MEILIPFFTLGGMYYISNQKKKKNSTHDHPNKQQQQQQQQSIEGFQNWSFLEKEQKQELELEQEQQQTHTNMIPFNGGKVRGQHLDYNTNESLFDSKVGNGSTFIKKTDQAPLFRPENNIHMTYGSQNQSDFIQSRMNVTMMNNDKKPFESELVGPGLNQGYSKEGHGGFNSGLEAREKYMPYHVDQLRIATNPKIEYELTDHEGPATSFIKNISNTQTIGRVEKNRPNTFYENTPDRWLATTGAIKGETQQSEQQMGNVKRLDENINYTGNAASTKMSTYVPQHFEASKKIVLPNVDIKASSATGKGPLQNMQNTHTTGINNRSTIEQTGHLGQIGVAIKAAMMPITDIFRPTIKQETIDNMRIYGDAKSSIPTSYVDNHQPSKTTLKETTLYEPSFYVNNQKQGMFVNNQDSINPTQREHSLRDYTGNASSKYGVNSYETAYNQHNNEIKSSTIHNRTNMGGTQIYNEQINVAANNKKHQYVTNERLPVPHHPIQQNQDIRTHGIVHLKRDVEDIGNARLDSNLLSSFRENPYTHSLHSY
jgi:hypothetical protein